MRSVRSTTSLRCSVLPVARPPYGPPLPSPTYPHPTQAGREEESLRDMKIGLEQLARHFDDEGIQTVAAEIGGPDEIPSGYVEIALGGLVVIPSCPSRVGVSTRRIKIGHDWGYNQLSQGAVQPKAENLILRVGAPVGVAATGILLFHRNPRLSIRMADMLGLNQIPAVVLVIHGPASEWGEVPGYRCVRHFVVPVMSDHIAETRIVVAEAAYTGQIQ